MGINRKLAPMKGHYFFLYAGLSPVAPFLPIIARDLGFSAFVVGTIFTIVPLISIAVKPLLGGIADKYQCQKLMFLALLFVQATFLFAIRWIPPLPPPGVDLSCGLASEPQKIEFCSVKLTEGNPISYTELIQCKLSCNKKSVEKNLTQNYDIYFLGADFVKVDNCISAKIREISDNCSNVNYKCRASCNETSVTRLSSDPSVPNKNIFVYYQFWLLFWCIVIWRVASIVLTSVGDAICFNLLGDRPNDFGLQRLWGAMGWGLLAVIAGIIVDKMSEGQEHKDYSSAFYISIFFLTLDFLVSSRLQYTVKTVAPVNMVKDLLKAFAKRDVVIFLIWCIINGIFSALVWNFLFWFLEEVAMNNGYDKLWIKTLDGLTLTVHCYLGEIPFFFFSGWLIKKIGHRNSMTLVLAAYGVRFIYYSYLTNPWWTLPIETLNGITFGTFYATMATYASSFAPAGTETMVQNVVCSLFDCLGLSIGTLMGGYLIDKIGSSKTFWYLGVFAVILTVIHALIVLFTSSSMDKYSEKGLALRRKVGDREFEVPLDPEPNGAQVYVKPPG